jgi:GntR family transcriptional regulator
VANAEEARLLAVLERGPVLRCERVTSTVDGVPVLVSEHTFPAHRTEFVVDLSGAERSIAPSGLRLVEEA